jgi:hypothetical protein
LAGQRQSYIDTWWQNKKGISINNSAVDIKGLEGGPSQYNSKLVFIMSNAEDGTQDEIVPDNSE